MRNGANVHHVSGRPDGTTALHECVARGHERIADLLLHYGASPFLENGRGASPLCQTSSSVALLAALLNLEGMLWKSAGLTAVDVAINCRNVALVRKLELRSLFQAMLLMKVPKWANLGTEWKHRCFLIVCLISQLLEPEEIASFAVGVLHVAELTITALLQARSTGSMDYSYDKRRERSCHNLGQLQSIGKRGEPL